MSGGGGKDAAVKQNQVSSSPINSRVNSDLSSFYKQLPIRFYFKVIGSNWMISEVLILVSSLKDPSGKIMLIAVSKRALGIHSETSQTGTILRAFLPRNGIQSFAILGFIWTTSVWIDLTQIRNPVYTYCHSQQCPSCPLLVVPTPPRKTKARCLTSEIEILIFVNQEICISVFLWEIRSHIPGYICSLEAVLCWSRSSSPSGRMWPLQTHLTHSLVCHLPGPLA